MLIQFFDKTMIVKMIEVVLLSNIKILGSFIPMSMSVVEREEGIQKKIFLYIISAVTVTIRFSLLTALQFLSGVVILNLIEGLIASF